MVVRACNSLRSFDHLDKPLIKYLYGPYVFPPPPDEDNRSPSDDDDDSVGDAVKSTQHDNVPAVNPTALLMHLISTLRENCSVLSEKEKREGSSVIGFARPPSIALEARIKKWLQTPDFGLDHPDVLYDDPSCADTKV